MDGFLYYIALDIFTFLFSVGWYNIKNWRIKMNQD